CVVVKDEELGRGLIRIGFTQLLDDPSAGRIPRNIEVQDAATVVADDKKAVEHVEGEGWNGEKVHRGYRFAVITQKRQPALGGFWVSRCSLHPAGDGRLRYLEAEHEEFPVDARRTCPYQKLRSC